MWSRRQLICRPVSALRIAASELVQRVMPAKQPLIAGTVSLLIAMSPISARSQGIPSARIRNKAVSALRKCTRLTPSNDCEIVTQQAIRIFKQGDKALLKPLLDLGLKSDGSLSEMLGSFFGEDVLVKTPRLFLSSIARRPRSDQAALSFLAGSMDGSGMPKNMFRDVKNKLRRILRLQYDPLAPVAKICLSSVVAANANR